VYISVTLGLLLGGAIGNLLDRFRLGYVVDFVDLGIGTFRWYTFNVADAAISLSLVLLVLLAIKPELAGTASPAADDAATTSDEVASLEPGESSPSEAAPSDPAPDADA
jgi:hypothetical protein